MMLISLIVAACVTYCVFVLLTDVLVDQDSAVLFRNLTIVVEYNVPSRAARVAMQGVLVDVTLVVVIEPDTNIVRATTVGDDEVISGRTFATIQVALTVVRFHAFSVRIRIGFLDALGTTSVDLGDTLRPNDTVRIVHTRHDGFFVDGTIERYRDGLFDLPHSTDFHALPRQLTRVEEDVTIFLDDSTVDTTGGGGIGDSH
mmetsp:Transcript_5882/g.14458  ORF Transcript_5882/g.14458 Transcript_5882/m.14458 type:complete len:201 (-) Transcript_5882:347-949(-)